MPGGPLPDHYGTVAFSAFHDAVDQVYCGETTAVSFPAQEDGSRDRGQMQGDGQGAGKAAQCRADLP